MQNRRFVFLALVTVSALAGIYLFTSADRSTSVKAFIDSEKSSFGSEDDPTARAKYEWMRLRDPQTGEIPPNIRAKELAFAATLPTQESLVSSGLHKSTRTQALTWQGRGPFNIGGRTRALAIDVTNENIILAGGVSGGMWRSTNGGSSWMNTTSPSDLHSITSLTQDTRAGKAGIWYYGTGELVGNSAGLGGGSFRGDGLYKSTNGGVSWTLLPSTSTGQPQNFDHMFDYVWNVITNPSNATQDEVYAATYGGIRRSVDGGVSWSTMMGGFSTTTVSLYTDIAITSTGVLYATLSQANNSGGSSPDRGIWRSINGVNWTNITPSGWPGTYRRIVIGIAPSNQNVVFFLAETPGNGKNSHSLWKYTYLSGNGSGSGGAWEDRSNNLPAFGGAVGNFTTQGSYDIVIKVKPDNENVVFIGGTNLYRSTDGFTSTGNTAWIGGYSTANNVSLYPDHHPDQHSLVFLPSNPNIMISGHDGGVSKTTNNLASTVSWASLNNGYFTTQFYAIAIDRATSGNAVIIGGMQDNGTWLNTTTSETTPWINAFSGDGAYCAIADGRTSYYVSSQLGNTYRLVLGNNGELLQWTKVSPTGGSGYLFINPFLLDPNNTQMMYLAGGSRIWRNSDLTAIPLFSNSTTSVNWTQFTNTSVSGTITALGASTNPANRLYYGTSGGQLYRLDDANVGNPTPTDVWTGKGFPANANVSCIAVDPTNASKTLAVFSNYSVISLFYTDNNGASWTAVSGNLEENSNGTGNGPSIRWAEIVPKGGTTYYFVGSSTGIYSTTTLNGSSTVWALEGASTIGNVVVDMIASRQMDGLVVAGTHGQGIYSALISTSSATITVTAPAANATWTVGTTQTVSWTSSGVTGNVHIKLSTDGGTTFPIAIASNTANDGTESIIVPNNPSTACRVRVESVSDPSTFGNNSGNFTIQAGVTCPPTWQAGLTVRDAGSNTANLSFGQGPTATNGLDVGCGEIELPPLPPTGVFDARFELPSSPPIASLKDYRNDSEQAINWRARFQPGASGNMTFSWNPADLPTGSFFLKDEITGTLVNVDMKTQSSYNLSNSNITSLKIEYAKEVCRNVNVISGWNIVSVPLLAANMNVSTLFPGAASSAFGFSNGYVATTTLTNGKGYWIRFGSAMTHRICGAAVSPREIAVNAGWNIIGPFESDVPVSAIISAPANIVISSYFGYNNGYTTTATLTAGQGYWVRLSQAGTLRIPGGSIMADIADASYHNRHVELSWLKIRLVDSGGNNGVLYLAPSGEGSGNFDLPPLPPAGVFDVRFSNSQYVEKLDGGRREIQISSAQYPLRVKGENLKDQVLTVKDGLSGNVLNETLEEGKEIILAATLEKLVIEAQLPARYELSQNYPNPFNPTTLIKFSLPEKRHVKLTLYTILGEKVTELVNQELTAGYHQVELNATGYASGLYVYVMEADDFRSYKKLVIAK